LISFQIVFYPKITKRLDVVNVKFLLEFLFGDATALALIAVAFAYLSALFVPVGAIVANIATFPSWMVRPRQCVGVKSGCTFTPAKMMSAVLHVPGPDKDFYTTLIAIRCYVAVKRVILSFVKQRVAMACTLATAIMAISIQLILRAKIWFFATVARNFDKMKDGARRYVRAWYTFSQHAFQFMLAIFRATWIGGMFDSPGCKLYFLTTVRTGNFDSVSWWHKKNLLFVVDRLLVEGIRLRIGGRANDSRSPASGQQMYALDRCIMPQIGGIA
jgi:hypothetical protein